MREYRATVRQWHAIPVYDLRHTGTGLPLDQGVPLRVVMEILATARSG
jgi:hypothetical protein